MKSSILLMMLLILNISDVCGQNPLTVVRRFGACLKGYFEQGDIDCRKELDNLTLSEMKCLVDDKISQSEEGKSGTVEINTYLNYFEKWAEIGNLGVQLDNLVWEKGFQVPKAYNDKDEEILNFVSGDLNVTGSAHYNLTNLFYVRGSMITKIVDYSGELSLGNAIMLYSVRRYQEAFRIFRKLAYSDLANYDAQYYTAIMEIKKQGCDFMDSEIRDKEAAWWCLKGYLSGHQDLAKLALRYTATDKGLPYSGTQYSIYSIRYERPFNQGLMVSRNKKGKYGYVNERNMTVIPHKFAFAFRFDDMGVALVVDDQGKRGYIDTKGKVVLPFIYDDGNKFVDGKTFVIKDKCLCLIDTSGSILRKIDGYISFASLYVKNYIIVSKQIGLDKKILWDIFDLEGNIVQQNCDKVVGYSDGLMVYGYRNNKKVFSGTISW